MAPITPASDSKSFMKDLIVYKSGEEDKYKKYLLQCKQECAKRLMDILYNPEWGTLDLKFWLMFAKRKFMGRAYN